MLTLEHLNQLADVYFAAETGEAKERAFADLYEAVTEQVKPHFWETVEELGKSEHEVIALFDDTLLKALETFKPGNGTKFSTYFYSVLRNKKIDRFRVRGKRLKREIPAKTLKESEEGEEENLPLLEELAVEDPAENVALEREEIREENRIIKTVLNEADEEEKPVISEIMRGKTVTATAKELGVCPKTVQRRLRRLREKVLS